MASTLRLQSIFEGRRGRSLGRNHGGTPLRGLFSYTAKDNLPRNGTAHDELGLLTSISNEDNDTDMPQANLVETSVQWGFPLPRRL